jgi:hypothetical protein
LEPINNHISVVLFSNNKKLEQLQVFFVDLIIAQIWLVYINQYLLLPFLGWWLCFGPCRKEGKAASILCFDVSSTSTPSFSYSWLHNETAIWVYIASQSRFCHRPILKSSVAVDKNFFMSAFGIYFWAEHFFLFQKHSDGNRFCHSCGAQ